MTEYDCQNKRDIKDSCCVVLYLVVAMMTSTFGMIHHSSKCIQDPAFAQLAVVVSLTLLHYKVKT